MPARHDSVTRRHALSAAGGSLLVGLAGCSSGSTSSTNSDSTTGPSTISSYKLISGPSQGVTFQMHNAAAGVVQRSSDRELDVVSGTSGQSLARLVSGQSDLGFATDVSGLHTRNREGDYAQFTYNYDLYQVSTQSTLIAPIVVHADSDLQHWSDLAGAKIATGPAGTTYQAAYQNALDLAVGEGNYELVHQGTSSISQALSANRVDGAGGPGIVSGLVPGFMQQVYSENDVRLLGLTDETEQAIRDSKYLSLQTLSNEAFGDSIEAYTDESQTTTVRVNYPHYSTNKVAAESIYGLLDVLYTNREALAEAHNGWQVFLDDEMWTLALHPDIPVHPGAVDFFKENEMWDDRLTAGSF